MYNNLELQEIFSNEKSINVQALRGEPFDEGIFAFRKDSYDFISGSSFELSGEVLESISTVKIESPNRFSNSLIQLSHAFAFANHYGIKKIVLPHFWYIRQGSNFVGDLEILNLPPHETWCPNEDELAISGKFFYASTLKTLYPQFTHYSSLNKVKDCFDLSIDVEAIPEDELVIHVRSGDVFRGNGANPGYGQPPLAFYKRVIEDTSYSMVHIVYENKDNPVIEGLLDFLKMKSIRFNVVSGDLQNDINFLLRAKNLVAGRGTFLPGITTISNNINKVYMFESGYDSWGRDDLQVICYKDTKGKYKEKVLKRCWKNSDYQRQLMLDYCPSFLTRSV